MTVKQAVRSLSAFVRKFTRDGVADKPSFREWCKAHETEMEKHFKYVRKEGMPSIVSLVSASFHPTEPLVMLNYTAGAHNTLHKFHEGWTKPLRQCRGIVFEMGTGTLIAKPFEKFFNYGEHPETRELPGGYFEATLKHDGHLGIIFRYRDKFIITTRGEFTSPTAYFAQEMLDKYVAQEKWIYLILPEFTMTILVEIIHPRTHVFVDYCGEERFVLLAVIDNTTLEDSDYENICTWGGVLGLEVAERWGGTSIDVLKNHMENLSVHNREGYVVRFEKNGLRVKFKFATYINMMVAKKLSYKYLMQRMISGNLDKMIGNLPEEVFERAQQMLGDIRRIVGSREFSEKEKREQLYKLVLQEESTQYYRKICRDFLARSNKT